jgi:pyrimidine operon attenuation protein/uracil phosphoribosyltransferase
VAATYILDQSSIALKIRRMALEIAERNTDASKIILAGIEPNGTIMSATIRSLLQEWYPGEIEEISIRLNKRHPTEIILSETPDLQNAVLVLVDDVANSGLVLIDRTHKEFPVKPDYVGLSIATSLEDFVAVELKNGELAGAIVDQKDDGIIL